MGEFPEILRYTQYMELKSDIVNLCNKCSTLIRSLTGDTSFKVWFEAVQSRQVDIRGLNFCAAEFGTITITRRGYPDAKYVIYAYREEIDAYKYGVPYSSVGINPFANLIGALTDYALKNKSSHFTEEE